MIRDLTVNLFETATRRRYAVMDALIRDHAARCGSRAARDSRDAELAQISTRAAAACTAWEIAYLHWRNSRGLYRGRTHGLRELLVRLRGREISRWQEMAGRTLADAATTPPNRNSAFRRLFPNGRRPFQQGGIDSRIAAVGRLAAQLSDHPALAAAAETVRDFHEALTNARAIQLHEARDKSARSDTLERERRAAALALYRNMGRLMEKYAETPAEVLTFFSLGDVRKQSRGGIRPGD